MFSSLPQRMFSHEGDSSLPQFMFSHEGDCQMACAYIGLHELITGEDFQAQIRSYA